MFTTDAGICARWERKSRNAETACASFSVPRDGRLQAEGGLNNGGRWLASISFPIKVAQNHAIFAPETWSNEAVVIQRPDPNVAWSSPSMLRVRAWRRNTRSYRS